MSKISVVGLGYVGLPLALLAAHKNHEVNGVDLDESKNQLINQGKPPIKDEFLDQLFKLSSIKATTDPKTVADSDIILVCVPTPVKNGIEPDLRPLKSAVKSIAPHLKKGMTLIIESTVNPGVCDEILIPLIEDLVDKKDGYDYFMVHCPERINPGDPKWNVGNINRVIGSNSEQGLEVARKFYESVIEGQIKTMTNIKEAEAVKVVENSFRDINIAFVNELAMSFQRMGINIENVIDGAATKPFAFMPHHPGIGVGGHCIPVDPYYLIEYARSFGFEHDFLRLARRINSGMPEYTVELLEKALNEVGMAVKGTNIAILGVSYKANVDDDRESPAYELIDSLEKLGANLKIYDPYIPAKSTVGSVSEALRDSRAIVLATAHNEFKDLSPEEMSKLGLKVFIDGRNLYRDHRDKFEVAKIVYRGIGIN